VAHRPPSHSDMLLTHTAQVGCQLNGRTSHITWPDSWPYICLTYGALLRFSTLRHPAPFGTIKSQSPTTLKRMLGYEMKSSPLALTAHWHYCRGSFDPLFSCKLAPPTLNPFPFSAPSPTSYSGHTYSLVPFLSAK